jgi:hypothetical protein
MKTMPMLPGSDLRPGLDSVQQNLKSELFESRVEKTVTAAVAGGGVFLNGSGIIIDP